MLRPHRVSLEEAPRTPRHGDPYWYLPHKMARNAHELALTLAWICDRKLFGRTYAALRPDYFWSMPANSGVLLRPIVTTARLMPGALLPGDIDLLIIPYHGSELILEQTLAIEIKAIRASYARQGKSPNEFGFSQTDSLAKLGFPYVGLVHLIVSDGAPAHEWRMMNLARVLDQDGRVEMLPPEPHDMLPADLMERAYGRLVANCRGSSHGLGAVYLNHWSAETRSFVEAGGYWMPNCRRAEPNERVSYDLLSWVGSYYRRNRASFLVNPSFDPEE